MKVTIPQKFKLSAKQIMEIRRKLSLSYTQISIRFEQDTRNIVFDCSNV